MNGFIVSIKKLLNKIKIIPDDKKDLLNCSGTIHEAMANAKLNDLVCEYKDLIVYLNKFSDDLCYYRIIVGIKTKDHVKVRNLEIILDLIKSFETQFIFMDKIRVYQLDGIIYLDIYRLDNDI